jgi:uncharacterized membrane protein YfhO
MDVLPRAYYVPDRSVQSADDTESALNLLRDGSASTVVVPNYVQGSSAALPSDPSTTVSVVSYTPERIEITLSAIHQSGLLVLSDTYYPGWTATVNREPAKIYRTNVMFRGVPVPKGESTVVFEYKPGWWPGILIFGGLTWLLALVSGIFLFRGYTDASDMLNQ